MKAFLRAIALSSVALVSACSYELEHDGAFDPNAPAEKQAKSIIQGSVVLQGEADSAGVDVQLQNNNRTYAVATDEAGDYKITGVVPGKYVLTISTRYFEGVTKAIDVPLGKRVSQGVETLAPRRSTVKGSAVARRMYNRQFVEEGGVVVSLSKEASIRGGAVTAATSPAAYAAADSIDMPQNSTISDNDGSFSLSGVPAGIYLIVASSPGVSTVPVGKVTVTGEGDITLEPITLEAVTGYFDIVGTADYQPSSSYTNDPDVTLKLAGFNAKLMMIGSSSTGNAEDCTLGSPELFDARVTYPLPSEGKNTLCVQFVAADGRESAVLTGSIVRDTLPPDATSVGLVVNAGGAYTDDNRVTVGLSAFDGNTGVDRMLVSERADFAGAVTQPFVPRMVYGFPLTDGVRTLWAKFGDRAGNYSAAVSAFVIVDKSAPVLNQFYVVNGYGEVVSAASPSRTSQVVLHLNMSDANPMEALVSDRVDFAGASWIPYRSDLIWNFIPPAAPEGALQTLYVKVRDAAGHLIQLAPYPVGVDTIAPQNVGVDVRGNGIVSVDQYTTTRTVTVNFTYPAVDTTWIELASDGSFGNKIRFSARPSTSYTLPDLDGVKPVYARFIDRAGNVSATVSDQIVLDTTPPQLAGITIPKGNYTSQGYVDLTLTAADAYEMQIVEVPRSTSVTAPADVVCGGAWETYRSSMTRLFDTQTEGARFIGVRYRDSAGNLSACNAAEVVYDATPPQADIRIVDSDVPPYAEITTSNVLRYYVKLNVTDNSPVTVQLSDSQNWAVIPKEPISTGIDVVKPWDAKAPKIATGELRTTYVRLVDAAGNAAEFEKNVTVVLLAASMRVSAASRVRNVTVNIGTSNANTLWLSEAADFSTYSEYGVAATTNVPFTLSDADGVKTIYGRFFSSDGSYVETNAIMRLDRQPPYVPMPLASNMNIDENAATTNVQAGTVNLALRAEDATTALREMKVANVALGQVPPQTCDQALANAAPETYQAYHPWTLNGLGAGVEGYRYVCASFSDSVGNWSAAVSDAIWYDTKFPVAGTKPLLVDGGKAYTNSASGLVNLAVQVSGASYMRFANDSDPYSGWVPYGPTYGWSVPLQQGSHTVNAQFADNAFNVVGPYTQNIVLDTIKPSNPTVAIISAATLVTNTASVPLQLSALDANYVYMSNDPGFPAFPYSVSTAFAGTLTYNGWPLVGSQGQNVVYVKYVDLAGNETGVVSDTIIYDSVAPHSTAVSIAGNAASVSDATGQVPLTLSAMDQTTVVSEMQFANITGAQTCAAALAGAPRYAFSTSYAPWILANTGTGVEGYRYVCARYRDQAFNWSAPVSDAVWFDDKDPVVTGPGIYINSGAAITNLRVVTLTFSQTGASQVQFANDMEAFSAWTPIAGSMNWTLPVDETAHTVWVNFKDAAGNVAGPYSAVITLDMSAPSAGSIYIAGSTGYTNLGTVDLVLSGSDAVSMDISNDGTFGPANRFAYATSYTAWPLSSGDGTKVIWARYIDQAGNASNPVSTTIIKDTLPPVAGAITVNQAGQTVTNATGITAYVSATGGAVDMYVSLGACLAGGAWESVQATKALTLPAVDATYTVYAAFRDAAMNVSTCQSKTIRLDRVLWAPSFSMAFTNTTVYAGRSSQSTEKLVFSSAGTDVTQFSLNGAAWQSIAGFTTMSLAAEGANAASVVLRDAAGNVSGAYSASIIRDTIAPVGTLTISGNGYTNTTGLTLALTGDADAYAMELSNTGVFAAAGRRAFATSTAWTIPTGEGTKTVSARFVDVVGNKSAPSTANVVYDVTPPSLGTVSINAGQAVTRDTAVTVTLNSTDAELMNVSQSACGGGSWVAYSASVGDILAGTDGTKTMYVKYRDLAGNENGSCVTDTIGLDRALATPGFAVAFTDTTIFAGHTKSNLVRLYINGATGDVSQIAVSSDPTFSSVAWQTPPVAGYLNIPLLEGANIWYVIARDAAYNTSTPWSATVTRDTVAPAAGSVSISGAMLYTNQSTVDLAFTYASDVQVIDVSNTNTFSTYSRYPAAPSLTGWALSSGDGTKDIYVRFLDMAHNESPIASTSIIYDSIVPTVSSIVVNGGLSVTNATTIDAAFTTTDAPNQMYASTVTCASPVWEPSFTNKSFTLGADGVYTVYAVARDQANNVSPCARQTITLDTALNAPSFAVAFTGATVYAGRTSGTTATLLVNGLTADVTQMAVANNPGLAGAAWQTKAASISVPLVVGVNTYYARLRDAAGNVSPDQNASITVDRSVNTPALSIADVTGDGKAVSMTQAELRWDGAVESDVVRFDLQVSTSGGSTWSALTTPACTGYCDTLGEESYTAAVTTAGGLTYQFRVRARDLLGNVSAWSNVAQTAPREPVREIYRIAHEDRKTMYVLKAPAAVTIAYDPGNAFAQGTLASVTIDNFSDPRWNEQLWAVMLDPFGNFAWSTTFSTGRSWYGTLDPAVAAAGWPAIDVDLYGFAHVAYRRAGTGLVYRTNRSGVWVERVVESGTVGDYAAIRVDNQGGVHFAYFDMSAGVNGKRLRYAFWNGSSFATQTAVSNSGGGLYYNGAWLAMDVDPSRSVGISFLSEEAATVKVKYVSYNGTAWSTPVVLDDIGLPAAGMALTSALRVTDGSVKVVYYHAGQQELRYTEAAAGSSVFSAPITLDTTNDVGQYNAIDVASDGTVGVAYVDESAATPAVKVITRAAGSWGTPSTVLFGSPVTGEVSLRYDAKRRARVAFGSAQGLMLARFEQGAWDLRVIDPAVNAGVFNGLALDRSGKVHLAYSGAGVQTVKYAAVDTFGWLANPADLADLDSATLAFDSLGRRHVAYRAGADLYYANDVDGYWRTWAVSTGASTDVGGRPNIAIQNTVPVKVYVSFAKSDASALYGRSYTLGDGAFGSQDTISDNSAADPSGAMVRTSLTGYTVAAYKNGSNVKYAYRTDSTSWTDNKKLDGSNDIACSQPALAAEPGTDVVYIACYTSSTLKISKITPIDTSVGSSVDDGGGTANVGSHPSLYVGTVAGVSKLHVAYANVTANKLKYTSSTIPGTLAWGTREDVDAAGATIDDIRLVSDAAGKAHITYYVQGVGLKYATNATGAWQSVVLARNSSGYTRGAAHTLVIDAVGKLHVGFVEDNTSTGFGSYQLIDDFAGWLSPSSLRQTK